jgi:glutaredoxin
LPRRAGQTAGRRHSRRRAQTLSTREPPDIFQDLSRYHEEVRRLVLIGWSLMLLGAARAPADDGLGKARALLDAGDLDRVVDAVNDAPHAPAPAAAALLGRAAQAAIDKGDRWMAGLFCQKALTKLPTERAALEICLRTALTGEQFDDARHYGDALGKLAPRDGQVAVWRARAALGDGAPAAAKVLLAPHSQGGPLASQVRQLIEQADEDIAKAAREPAQKKDLEATLAKAVADAHALGRNEEPAADEHGEVVLYTTSWCGVCKKAKAWLKNKGVAYTEKDVERDKEATLELGHKCAQAGVRAHGVPVLDAHGRLVVGFDANTYELALR